MLEVALPLAGGCLCGACRYELRQPPFMVYICHCADCRRQSGSAFGMSMPAPRSAFALLRGEPRGFDRTLPSGRTSVVRFCGTCGTRLYSESSAEVMTLRPGTLDDPSWVTPIAQAWTRSALPWACLAEVPTFDENPPNYAALADTWRDQDIRFIAAPKR